MSTEDMSNNMTAMAEVPTKEGLSEALYKGMSNELTTEERMAACLTYQLLKRFNMVDMG